MLNVYVVARADSCGYDEYDEQTIIASTEKRAIKLASKEYGEWIVVENINLYTEQILTQSFNAG